MACSHGCIVRRLVVIVKQSGRVAQVRQEDFVILERRYAITLVVEIEVSNMTLQHTHIHIGAARLFG